MPESQNLLKDVLSVLAARESSSASNSQLPIQELVRLANIQFVGSKSIILDQRARSACLVLQLYLVINFGYICSIHKSNSVS